ncbi:transporter substrate-binding domain-containing protein [Aeromicrobium sp. 636]|uniref:Amino acid ABC transporter substrate-binding protein n=2 Tax=Nocardioidaceae TaxID=85015 RepID=A0A8I0EWY8_9ACTN|nr:amino acid ABC transporter substrate-binding protein [Aeromicrobium senzhongii]MCQ3998957.1 transporter substrate-binding domain-containing protein [Aeromicrobium sp. 636]MTB89537.1 transporter substrate-binding domain-containing protein [Aeromicrobium senzhongii]QNL94333.1 amino acid ABC transporter substrate-binding protein [Aeromicrobium senzhongii]
MQPMKRSLLAVPLALMFSVAAACAPADDSDDAKSSESTTSASQCAVDQLPLTTKGKLTIGTDDPAFEPWFSDNDPSNGKGFESAVAYAVAEQMGFAKDDVVWTKVPFNTAYQPGKKGFDFDINQVSITEDRKKAVDFSKPYYSANQAIIVMDDSKFADVDSLDDFKAASLGAQIGTTSLKAIESLGTQDAPLVYDDTTKAALALTNGQVDGIVADLPTAFYLVAAEIEGAKIAGQFEYAGDEPEEFGLLLQKDSELTSCVDAAVTALTEDGTFADLEQKWLSSSQDVPVLK